MSKTNWHSLAEKNVWVMGGAGYLGSAITRALDEEGASVLCVDLGSRAADFVDVEKLKRTIPMTFDASVIESIEPFVEQMTGRYGVPDGIVNLTLASSSGKTLEALSAADFAKPFVESVTSYFILARALAERMKPRGSGSLVHFASMYGIVAPDPAAYEAPMTPNPVDYGASKAAVIQMNRYLAIHYGPVGIRFNCVAPGPFPNPQLCLNNPDFIERLAKKTPLNRVGASSEIVGPTLFLLTDSASYVTGQCLIVDGGWTAW